MSTPRALRAFGLAPAAAIFAFALATPSLEVSGIAHAAERDVELSAGALVGIGTTELGATPYVGGTYVRLWNPVSPLGIGMRFGLGAAIIPYGNADGEPVIGSRSGYDASYLRSDPTLLPSAGVALRLHAGAALSFTAHASFSFLVSDQMGAFSIFPIPTAGVAAACAITPSLSARAGLTNVWLYNGNDLLIPTAGLAWTL